MAKDDEERFGIALDGRWSLEDLYTFPRTFEQVYFATYSFYPELEQGDSERVERTYGAFPWQGGYSAVNFYNQLRYATNPRYRPKILSIHYGSPGLLDLVNISTDVATRVGVLVGSLAASAATVNYTYSRIMKDLQERKLMRIEEERGLAKLAEDELRLVRKYSREILGALGLEDAGLIDRRTGHPYRSLKLLLSFYRRLRVLAEFEIRGKAKIPNKQKR